MRFTGSRTYYRPSPPKMPPGLVELMEGLTKEVLRHNPSDVYEFCARHVQRLLEKRDGPSNRKSVSLEDKILRAQEKVRQRAEKRKQVFDKNITEQGKISNTQSNENINTSMLNVPQVHPLDIADNSNSDSNKDHTKHTDISVQEQIVQYNALQVPVPCEIEFEKSSEVEICQEFGSDIFTQKSNVDSTNLTDIVKDAELIITNNKINIEKVEPVVSSNSKVVSDANKMDMDINNKELTARSASNEDVGDYASTKRNKTEFEQDMDITLSKQSYDTIWDIENGNEKVENSTLMIADKKDTVVKVSKENVSGLENSDIEKCIDNSKIHNTVNTQIEFEDKQAPQGKLYVQAEKSFIEHTDDNVAQMANIGPVNDSMVNFDNSKITRFSYMQTPSLVEKLGQSINVKDQNDHSTNVVDSPETKLENNKSHIHQENSPIMEESSTRIATLKKKNAEAMEISDATSNFDTNLNDDNDETSNNIKSIKDEIKLLIPFEPHLNIKPAGADILPALSDNSMDEEQQDIDIIKTTSKVTDEIAGVGINKVDDANINIDVVTTTTNLHVPTQEITKNNSMDYFANSSSAPTDSSDTDKCDSSDIDILANKNKNTQREDHTSNMDLETAAITIQKIFRTFLFKSRGSTFEDTANDKSMFLDEVKNNKEKSDLTIASDLSLDRRTHGINRMDTVLQTVNEEKSLSLSTDDSSTLSNAATIIQAHVRGFLVRNKLNSNKTMSTNSFTASTSNDPSITSIDVENDENKNKTILNIHIVPDSGDYLSRDESLITSMDMSMDMSMDSPPSSINLHPSSNDNIERRRRLKREDAIQSISPPTNNGKLSEDIDSGKDIIDHEIVNVKNHLVNDSTDKNDGLVKESVKDILNESQLIQNSKINEEVADNVENISDDPQGHSENKTKYLTKMYSDEKDVVTPVTVNNDSRLIHSGEFHDVVMPTEVSRSDTSVVREFKNVLVYFLLWNHS